MTTHRSRHRRRRVFPLFFLAAVLTLPPLVASGQDIVTQVSAGGIHTCAVMSGGRVKCWGDNSEGQLGEGTTINRSTPVDVAGLSFPVSAIATGAYHSCALSTAGAVKCWGDNLNGQLGDGTTVSRSMPVDVIGLTSDVQEIATGAYHTCALTRSGAVLCWGANSSGQLGDGTGVAPSRRGQCPDFLVASSMSLPVLQTPLPSLVVDA
jgi:alpha-tubulin suppressor-like RCC1 family protein